MPGGEPDSAPQPRSAHEAPEQNPGFLLWRTTLAWQRRVQAALRPHGLTHVQFVLLASAWWLEEREGSPTQARVARHAGTDPMMTSQVLRRLEAAGLLRRRGDRADTRVKRIELTAGGRRRLAGALTDVERVDQEFFAPAGGRRAALLEALASLGEG